MPLSESRKIYRVLTKKLGFSSDSAILALSRARIVLDEVKPTNATDNQLVFKCYLISALLVPVNFVTDLTYTLFNNVSKENRSRDNISREISRFNRKNLTAYLERNRITFHEGESKTISIMIDKIEKVFFEGNLEKNSNPEIIDSVKNNCKRLKDKAKRKAKESV
jgi:hypothetical protein